MRNAMFAVCLLVSTSAMAATDYYLKIPGVAGGSVSKGHAGWLDVESQSVNLAPPVMDGKKLATLQCSAAAEGVFGAAGANVAGLVGMPIAGDVVIEAEHAGGKDQFVIYSAVLKGALITHYATAGASDSFRDSVALSFTQIIVTTTEQKEDGSAGAKRTGSFDCTHP